MQSELSCNGKTIELNDFVSSLFARLVFSLTANLQGVAPDASRIEVVRTPADLQITCDGDDIEWFMGYPRTAIQAIVDAAVQTLRGCEDAETYTLGVRR